MSKESRRSSTLISPAELQSLRQQSDINLVILDCTWYVTGRDGKEDFVKEHIPGAQFFDINVCRDTASDQPFTIPDAETFQKYVGELGVSNDSRVILYDNNPKFGLYSAPRVWWTFIYFGHTNISILEGGLPKYVSEGYELTAEVEPVEAKEFVSKPKFCYLKKYKDVEENLESGDFQFVDARTNEMFNGDVPGIKSGSIPKSVNLPFFELLDVESRGMKSTEELRDIFTSVNIDLEKPVVSSCVGGMTCPVVLLAAYLCGSEDFASYNGSWLEWRARAPDHLKLNMPTQVTD